MSKRIRKFRVWSIMNNKMIINKDVNIFLSVDDDGQLNSVSAFGENPIMEYTGRDDKNGKEIYESDLVLCRDKNGELLYEHPVPIIWVNAMWCVHLADPAMSFGMRPIVNFSGNNMEIEVVGNIYENI